MKSKKDFDEVLTEFFKLLRERDEKHTYTKVCIENLALSPAPWDITFGRKYVKIIRDKSVYAFIEIGSGDIYMPASWSAPAKHVRGNIFNDDPLVGTGVYGVNYLK